jgi:hypothetical protein
MRIDLVNEKGAYLPGEKVHGKLQWDFDFAPERIQLQLGWKTEGKGTEDSETVGTETVVNPTSQGSKEFLFELPEGPYSFSGRLISLIWYVRASLEPESEEHRVEIVVSPSRQEIILPVGPEEEC